MARRSAETSIRVGNEAIEGENLDQTRIDAVFKRCLTNVGTGKIGGATMKKMVALALVLLGSQQSLAQNKWIEAPYEQLRGVNARLF
jgi:hypothetical protein